MSERVYYITTAIDYANGPPHVGHAVEKIGADVMARYRRLTGRSTHFVIGTDEHGLKVMQSAEAAGVSPRAWVDDIAGQFQAAWRRLHISHDDFIRTTEPRHRRAVEAIIAAMSAAGDLYRGTYSGYYCIGCEAYKAEAELEAMPGDAETGGHGDTGTRGRGDTGTRGRGHTGTRGRGDTGTRGRGHTGTRGQGDTGTLGPGDTATLGPGDTATLGPGDTGTLGPGDTGSSPASPRPRVPVSGGGGVAGSASGGGGVGGLRCPLHPTRPIEWMQEENWFFRLSRYQQPLLALLEERPDFVQPELRRNEIRRVLQSGLDDISVSRARLPWGVPWPGDPEHTVYVWIDALTNYLSAVGYPDAEYTRYWPADVHVIGKDITRFHCIYWPAMLLSAGIALPRTVWAHGFLSYEGRKLSKSEGGWVELEDALVRHGADALRYYLLREVPWNGDGDFSWTRFDDRYTAELADDLGNLVNRTISMIERYRAGVVPHGHETELDRARASALDRYRQAMDAHLLHQGLAIALELADAANRFVEERAPWRQAREPAQAAELDATLAALAHVAAALATLLEPFLPTKMAAVAERLGLECVTALADVATLDLAGRSVRRGEILFPKESA